MSIPKSAFPHQCVSALMPRARNVTIKKTCCPRRDGALLAHVPRSKKKNNTYTQNKRGDVCSTNAYLSTPFGTRTARCRPCASMEDDKPLTPNTTVCAHSMTRDTRFATPICKKKSAARTSLQTPSYRVFTRTLPILCTNKYVCETRSPQLPNVAFGTDHEVHRERNIRMCFETLSNCRNKFKRITPFLGTMPIYLWISSRHWPLCHNTTCRHTKGISQLQCCAARRRC